MGRAPKFCANSSCPNKVVGRSYCDDHAPQAWSGGLNAWQGHGTTRAQRTLIAKVLAEEPYCRDCGWAVSTEAGHIRPRSKGGTYTRDNLKGQCRACNLAQMKEDRKPQGSS